MTARGPDPLRQRGGARLRLAAWGGLPPGPGREEVFYTCQVCHSLKTVLQQRLSRDVWDETLVWMVEEQGMPAPEPKEYARILDYLGT